MRSITAILIAVASIGSIAAAPSPTATRATSPAASPSPAANSLPRERAQPPTSPTSSPIVTWKRTFPHPPRNATPETYRRLLNDEYERSVDRALPWSTWGNLARRYNMKTSGDTMFRLYNNCTVRYAIDPTNAFGQRYNITLPLYFALREWDHATGLPVATSELYRHTDQWGYYDADFYRRGRYDPSRAILLRERLNSVYRRYENAYDVAENERADNSSAVEYRPHQHDGYAIRLGPFDDAEANRLRHRIVADVTAAQLRHWFPSLPLEEVDASGPSVPGDRCSTPGEVDLRVSFEPPDHSPRCPTYRFRPGVLAHSYFTFGRIHLVDDGIAVWPVAYSHLPESTRVAIREYLSARRPVALTDYGAVDDDLFLEHIMLHEIGHWFGLSHKYPEESDDADDGDDTRWRERYRPYSIMSSGIRAQFLHVGLGRYDGDMVRDIGREIAFWNAADRYYDELWTRCRTDDSDGLLFLLRVIRLRETMATVRAREELDDDTSHALHRAAVSDASCAAVLRLPAIVQPR